jgi:hypothetical protein
MIVVYLALDPGSPEKAEPGVPRAMTIALTRHQKGCGTRRLVSGEAIIGLNGRITLTVASQK